MVSSRVRVGILLLLPFALQSGARIPIREFPNDAYV